MSDREFVRRVTAKNVMRKAWWYYKGNLHGLTFRRALLLAWRTVRGMQRLIYSKARGVMKENVDGIYRQKILAKLARYPEQDVTLSFEREDDNIYDSNAVKIIAHVNEKGWACVGYLSKDLAREVAPLLDEGYEAILFFLGVTGYDRLGLNFAFTVMEKTEANLPIPTHYPKQKDPQMAS
jgi:hypothetical protein